MCDLFVKNIDFNKIVPDILTMIQPQAGLKKQESGIHNLKIVTFIYTTP